jgi:hypothetical protein
MSIKKFTSFSEENKKIEMIKESLTAKETDILHLLGCKDEIKKISAEQYEIIRHEIGSKDITSLGVFCTGDSIVIKSKETFENWENALDQDLDKGVNFAQVDGEFLAVLDDTIDKVDKILKAINK